MQADVTPSEHVKLIMQRQENLINEYCDFLLDCLMLDKVNVADIPLSILLSNSCIYLTVFRLSKKDSKTAINVL